MTGSDDHASRERAEGGEGFLSRWSRRKSAERAAGPAHAPADADPEPAAAGDAPADAADPAPVELTDADMPPLDTLDDESDYSPFLSPKVSEGLRRAALRRLFASAKFNVVDGLDDYAEDYRDVEPLVAALSDRLLDRESPVDAERAEPVERSPDTAGAAPQADEPEASPEAGRARDDGDTARSALAETGGEAASDPAPPEPGRG